MTYAHSPREFDLSPKNRYAAMRLGIAEPLNRPDPVSDLHRLSGRLVALSVLAAIGLVVAVLLPSAFEAVGNAAAIYDLLGPVAR